MDWKVDHKLKKISGAIRWLGNGMGSQPATWEVVRRDDPNFSLVEVRGTYQHGDGGYDWGYLVLNHAQMPAAWGFKTRDAAVDAGLKRLQQIFDEYNGGV